MANKTKAKEKTATVAGTTTSSLDKIGLCVVITTGLSRIILIALICFLCVLGMVVLFILEIEAKQATHLTTVYCLLHNDRKRKCCGTTERIMDVLTRPAEEFENDQSIETMWAIKAYEHAEVYFNVNLVLRGSKYLKLTPVDDTIYRIFREEFPMLDIRLIKEDELKSTEEKAKWRPFCERFKNLVEDYSYERC
ncbi:hypothetical protein NQ318_017855 [Aromia moschata]|uniref:Polysaccharide biosynthesis domain-containing protein n=1 Tax=Aromia moschata TaxID=1265417 RepID=A0AAV8XQD2_9CUCU|nr:hypothetical protein NQ318_017855 [Aromia moschata]